MYNLLEGMPVPLKIDAYKHLGHSFEHPAWGNNAYLRHRQMAGPICKIGIVCLIRFFISFISITGFYEPVSNTKVGQLQRQRLSLFAIRCCPFLTAHVAIYKFVNLVQL